MDDCPPCIALSCSQTEDQELYSIESPLYPFVLNCPPGFDCNEASEFHMLCCGQLLTAVYPQDATFEDKMVAIQEVVNACAVRQAFCGDLPTVPPPPGLQLFYNGSAQCSLICPDGNSYIFIVPAGSFVDISQAIADERAQAFACQQAAIRKLCLGNIQKCACLNVAYSSFVPHTGGLPPIRYTINSGALPTGLSISNTTGEIFGTPILNGTYNFTVHARAGDGSYMNKPYTIVVLEITTTQLDAYSVGVPYSFQLQAAGGSGNYAWKITAGSLPPGLTMDSTGLISGTPT